MKLSDGFNRLEPSVLIFIFYSLSLGFLALTLKRLPIGYAYAVWSGLGTFLIVFIGLFFFHESITFIKVASLTCIIAGVTGLRQA